MSWEVRHGDCVEAMRAMPAGSVDAVVCDPPYGLEFMGKEWDSFTPNARSGARADGGPSFGSSIRYQEQGIRAQHAAQSWHQAWATEALRVLKPGGHLLAFGGTRTYHRLVCAVEDAGLEIRDTISWLYGSGFPKSLDVSKAIDRQAGAEREVVGAATGRRAYGDKPTAHAPGGMFRWGDEHFAWDELPAHAQEYFERKAADRASVTAPATPEAQQWAGWGTALKPAHEPVVVARKPLSGTVAQTVLEHGTGALNVDGCRVGSTKDVPASSSDRFGANGIYNGGLPALDERGGMDPSLGRWPANVVLSHMEGCVPVGTRTIGFHNVKTGAHLGDKPVTAWCHPDCPVRLLDEQTGEQKSGTAVRKGGISDAGMFGFGNRGPEADLGYGDTGGASRFFPTFTNQPEETECADVTTSQSPSGGTSPDAPDADGESTRTGGSDSDVRFRYCAKASRAERNAGLDGFEERHKGNDAMGMQNMPIDGHGNPQARVLARANNHPTVKPIELMRWLVRLVTPPPRPCETCGGCGVFQPVPVEHHDPHTCEECEGEGVVRGRVLDPFAGSGSTGCAAVLEGFDFVGLEREEEYVEIARARIGWWERHRADGRAAAVLAAGEARDEIEATGQIGMFEMSASERAKGARGELEVVGILRAHGWLDAKRTSDGRAQIERGDIADGPAGLHIEVRRRETVAIWAWLKQAEEEARSGELPVVCFRRSRSKWYAALELDELLRLLPASQRR